jgi:hypothetical protein
MPVTDLESRIDKAIGTLDLAHKVRLLSGAAMFSLHPKPAIGLPPRQGEKPAAAVRAGEVDESTVDELADRVHAFGTERLAGQPGLDASARGDRHGGRHRTARDGYGRAGRGFGQGPAVLRDQHRRRHHRGVAPSGCRSSTGSRSGPIRSRPRRARCATRRPVNPVFASWPGTKPGRRWPRGTWVGPKWSRATRPGRTWWGCSSASPPRPCNPVTPPRVDQGSLRGGRSVAHRRVRTGQARGEIDPEAPVGALVHTTVAVMDGLQQQWLLRPDQVGMVKDFAGTRRPAPRPLEHPGDAVKARTRARVTAGRRRDRRVRGPGCAGYGGGYRR